MAHYHLNVVNSLGFVPDEEGHDLPDLAAARAQAVAGVRSMLSDELRTQGLIDLRGRIEIAEEHGTVVLVVPFSAAVDVIPDESPSASGGT
ncbi:DUF6894 family protein [Sphingomonas sp. DT-207]|uniref:DUF6894 family protein n=1 Tax=Sphingomonas sp. DT-207 TaxID=3396167 RepID=UPI003F1A62D2